MANVKISQLTAAASVTGTQEFEINDSGTSKKVTGSQIAVYVESEVSSSPTLTGQVSFADGTAALPSITNTGDTNTGVFFHAADTVAITTGGTERMRIDSSGNVGIGTASGGYRLFVYKDNGSTAGVSYPIVAENFSSAAGNTNGAGVGLQHSGRAAASLEGIRTNPAADYGSALVFKTNNTAETAGTLAALTERMRIDASGNVGIGTTSPGAKLDVTNNQAALSYLIDTNNTTNGGSSIWRMITRNIANTGTTSVEFYKPTGSGFSLLNNDTNGSNFTAFNVGASERMRIDSSGNVLVGTTSNPGGGFGGELFVVNTAGNTSLFRTTAGTSAGTALSCARTSNGIQISFHQSGSAIGSINTNGTATAYNTSSDYRLKENVAPMQNALDTVAQLNPVTYTWKADGSAGQGFIAHELQAVVPDCVTGEKDAVDAEGNPQYQGVDTSFLVATLVKAIQELTARVATLEAK